MVSTVAALMWIRIFGVFLVLPVLAICARELPDATPSLIGLALGGYGLTQCLLQLPFGMLSDYLGRKRLIILGFTLLIMGSLWGIWVTGIVGLIMARMLQGSGAIGSVSLALLCDVTRPLQRARALAVVGVGIGISFVIAMVSGPVLLGIFELSGMFAMIAGLACFGLILAWRTLPAMPVAERSFSWRQCAHLLTNTRLWPAYLGVCVQHAVLAALFVALPQWLQDSYAIAIHSQWPYYLALLIGTFPIAFVLGRWFDRSEGHWRVLMTVGLLSWASLATLTFAVSATAMWLSLWGIMAAFNAFEAMLPAYVSRIIVSNQRGAGMGLYSSAQFLGMGLGGVLGAFWFQTNALPGVAAGCAIMSLTWWFFCLLMIFFEGKLCSLRDAC